MDMTSNGKMIGTIRKQMNNLVERGVPHGKEK